MKEKYKHLLEVSGLYTSFNIPAGEVRSVNGISFTVDKGKVLGIVGESGSGKSVTAYSIMQILQNPGRIVGGSIKFKGKELIGLPHHQLQKIRGEKISIIFQDPMSSLNPVYTIGNQMKEAIRLHPVKHVIEELENNVNKTKKAYKTALSEYKVKHSDASKKKLSEAKENYRHAKYHQNNYVHERAIKMLELVGINEPERRLKQYPFEFSGGMLQRIMIAMSLVCEPDLLIADEPTTALDVTIQAQILELLKSLQEKMGMGIIIITHDLGVVAQICDEVDVMYAGRIVEKGTVNEIFYNPKHEYTKGLMNSIPQANDTRERLVPIEGNPVDVFCLPKGCSFAPRCASCMKICLKKYPCFIKVNNFHQSACFKYALEAYKHKKITKAELKKIINDSYLGNKAFTPISEMEVFDAYNDYRLAEQMYENVTLKNDKLSIEEKEQIYYHVKDKKANWRRAKNDLKVATKTHKQSRRDLPSMERGDMAKKIAEAKKRVKYVDDAKVVKKDLYQYLEKLNISSYPVDYRFHRENVAIAKEKYRRAQIEFKYTYKKDRLEKSKAICLLDEAKKNYENAIDIYARNRRVTRKLLKTREKLIKVNAKRVKQVIKTNAVNAYKEFKAKHLMFTEQQELENYLNGFVYAHWDFDKTVTRRKLGMLYRDWQNKQSEIYRVRDLGKNTNVDKLIREKNEAMYKYWFNRSDFEINRYHKKHKNRFEYGIRYLNRQNHHKSRVIYRDRRAK